MLVCKVEDGCLWCFLINQSIVISDTFENKITYRYHSESEFHVNDETKQAVEVTQWLVSVWSIKTFLNRWPCSDASNNKIQSLTRTVIGFSTLPLSDVILIMNISRSYSSCNYWGMEKLNCFQYSRWKRCWLSLVNDVYNRWCSSPYDILFTKPDDRVNIASLFDERVFTFGLGTLIPIQSLNTNLNTK